MVVSDDAARLAICPAGPQRCWCDGLVTVWRWGGWFLGRLARLARVLGLCLPDFPGAPPLAEPKNGEAGVSSDQVVAHFFQIREKSSQALL